MEISEEPLIGAAVGGAQVRILVHGHVVYPPGGLGYLAEPGTEGLTDLGDYRVVSRAL